MVKRPELDAWFMSLAELVSQRSTCDRAHVGCVLAKGNRLLSVGYAGSAPGAPHCEDVGCDIGPHGGCIRTTHAERNAVANYHGHAGQLLGATAYVTLSPCLDCYRYLRAHGIARVVYGTRYRLGTDHLGPECLHYGRD